VIDVELPAGPPASALVRSFAACLASVTEAPLDELPLLDADLATTLGPWRNWLAEHGAGLVPIAEPNRFQWAGWWIATVRRDQPDTPNTVPDEVAVLAFGTPPGIVLSPLDPSLLGHATAELTITGAYAVASLDPVLRPTAPTPDQHGTVEALAVAPVAEADMRLLEVAHAIEGRGLDGDRYAAGAGTFSPRTAHRPGYDLTLIAAEVLDELATTGSAVDFTSTRRNVLTRGIDLDVLIGRTFRLGDVLCRGRRRCEPCAHLERVSGPGHLRPLIHRGGLRADILTDGTIPTGAPIRLVPHDRRPPAATPDPR
jgi:hypothetical protein